MNVNAVTSSVSAPVTRMAPTGAVWDTAAIVPTQLSSVRSSQPRRRKHEQFPPAPDVGDELLVEVTDVPRIGVPISQNYSSVKMSSSAAMATRGVQVKQGCGRSVGEYDRNDPKTRLPARYHTQHESIRERVLTR